MWRCSVVRNWHLYNKDYRIKTIPPPKKLFFSFSALSVVSLLRCTCAENRRSPSHVRGDGAGDNLSNTVTTPLSSHSAGGKRVSLWVYLSVSPPPCRSVPLWAWLCLVGRVMRLQGWASLANIAAGFLCSASWRQAALGSHQHVRLFSRSGANMAEESKKLAAYAAVDNHVQVPWTARRVAV